MGGSTVDCTHDYVNPGFVRQKPFRLLELGQGTVIIAKPVVGVQPFLPMDFAGIRLDLFRML